MAKKQPFSATQIISKLIEVTDMLISEQANHIAAHDGKIDDISCEMGSAIRDLRRARETLTPLVVQS